MFRIFAIFAGKRILHEKIEYEETIPESLEYNKNAVETYGVEYTDTTTSTKQEVKGTEVKMTGRIQSRMYEKKHEDGTIEPRIAYEVSMANLELIGENKKSDETEQNESNQEKSKVEE